MKIDIKDSNEITAFLIGRLDTKASVECAPTFDKLAEHADRTIMLDCSQLEYISSSGLRLFLSLAKKSSAAGGHLTVIHPKEDVKDVFKLTGFYKLLNIVE
ncbi:MAG: STAS domain-containing protein [Prevotella sp.]|nr:STAS domain-containing protein [Prevotella sp.]